MINNTHVKQHQRNQNLSSPKLFSQYNSDYSACNIISKRNYFLNKDKVQIKIKIVINDYNGQRSKFNLE